MTKKAADTGSGPAGVVAMEQHFPKDERLINDDLAGKILPFGMKVYVWLAQFAWVRDWFVRMSEKSAPGAWAIFPVRKRYIDDKVVEAVAEQVDAVVNLGVGFDTQPFRLPALADVPVFEVDQPVNIDARRSLLKKVLGEVPANLTLVSIDFDCEDLGAVLASHDYAADTKAFFVLEAVTQYLTEAGIQKTFDFLAKAPTGSRLAFTYVPKDFIDGKVLFGNEFMYKKMVLKDKIWLFGIDPEGVDVFLSGYGWRVLEHLSYEELAEVYVKPTGRKLESLAYERVVYAEKL
jgi:methyltransferase (TIGR00027 family)